MDVRSTALSAVVFFLLARLASRSWPPRFFRAGQAASQQKKNRTAAAWAFFCEVVVGGSQRRDFLSGENGTWYL